MATTKAVFVSLTLPGVSSLVFLTAAEAAALGAALTAGATDPAATFASIPTTGALIGVRSVPVG